MKDWKQVVVKMEVYCTVLLPPGKEHAGMASDDPAIEAALEAMPGEIHIALWGEDEPCAVVNVEADERDCEIEDDDR